MNKNVFKLATLNVFSFFNSSHIDGKFSELIRILQPLNLDLIAVQEIQNDENWSIFCEKLSFPYQVFAPAPGDSFGNGVASRFPIDPFVNKITERSYVGGVRSFMEFQLKSDHPFTFGRTFAVTHLDYLTETARMQQLHEFKISQSNVDILLGDMNSLTREDYTKSYFEENVVRPRAASHWEKPTFELTTMLTKELSFCDVFQTKNPELKDEHVVTCAHHTRIDYIFVKPKVLDQWKIEQCSILDMNRTTDHQAVFATFQKAK